MLLTSRNVAPEEKLELIDRQQRRRLRLAIVPLSGKYSKPLQRWRSGRGADETTDGANRSKRVPDAPLDEVNGIDAARDI